MTTTAEHAPRVEDLRACFSGRLLTDAADMAPFLTDWRKRYTGRALAVAQPDVVNCGGLMQAKKIAALAEAEYVSLAPHNPNGPVATCAAVHLAAAIPNFLILETIGSEEDRALQAQVIDPPLQLEDGCFLLPTGPGLGMRLDEEACARYPYQTFEGWR